MIVSRCNLHPFEQVNRVGVAIMRHAGGLHCAFLCRPDDENPMLVHLAWHHELRRDAPDDRYLWADFAELEFEDRRALVAYLSLIDATGDLPYGLNSEGISFDPNTGRLQPHPEGRGMTCATFILSVLRAFDHDVVDADTWVIGRPGDAEWQALIVGSLSQNYPEQAAAVAGDLGCVRFRPDEVVGSAARPGWPHDMAGAEALGAEVLSELDMPVA